MKKRIRKTEWIMCLGMGNEGDVSALRRDILIPQTCHMYMRQMRMHVFAAYAQEC